jgi:hypothetical protein
VRMENTGGGTRARDKQGAVPIALRQNNRQAIRGRALPAALGELLAEERGSRAQALGWPGAPTAAPHAAPGSIELPLAEAVRSASEDALRAMLDGARASGRLEDMLDERNLRRQTPLHIAADAGRHGVVRLLLEHDAPVNVVGGRGETALHAAAANGHTQVVRLLLERGAKVLSDKQGQTPLHRAAQRGHAPAVAVMLGRDEPWFSAFAEAFERGESDGGSTPLHVAAVAGHATVVKAIMSAFSGDPATLQKLKTAKNRWGDVPAEMTEGPAPPMLTACVRETLQKRKEAQDKLKRSAEEDGSLDGSTRWRESPSATPKLPCGVQRRLAKEARERSRLQFEAMRHELCNPNPNPGSSEQDNEHGGWETPRTIRKTSFSFVLLPDGEVDLECVYQRYRASEGEGTCGGGGGQAEVSGGRAGAEFAGDDSGDLSGKEEDLIDADCEFEFNFDLMGMGYGSGVESGDEWSDEDEDTS